MNVAKKAREILAAVENAAKSKRSDGRPAWAVLHNLCFGIGGLASDAFRTEAERIAFQRTEEFEKLMELLRNAQKSDDSATDAAALAKANGNISLRLPSAIHAALLREAEAEGVSLNQLCLAKLCVQLRARV